MKYFAIAFLTGLLCACGSPSHEYSAPGTPPDEGKQSDPGDGTVNFAAVTAAFQRNQCLNCHSNRGGNRAGINLETFEAAKSFAGDIREAVDAGVMPPRGPAVNSQDKAVIDAWVVSGTPR